MDLLGKDGDSCIQNQPLKHANNRQIGLLRGRFLGGSSGCNGTSAIRGTKQDYDDWEIEGWSGDEVFDYMKKVHLSMTACRQQKCADIFAV